MEQIQFKEEFSTDANYLESSINIYKTDIESSENQYSCGKCITMTKNLIDHQMEYHAGVYSQKHTQLLAILRQIQTESMAIDSCYEILTSICKVPQIGLTSEDNSIENVFVPSMSTDDEAADIKLKLENIVNADIKNSNERLNTDNESHRQKQLLPETSSIADASHDNQCNMSAQKQTSSPKTGKGQLKTRQSKRNNSRSCGDDATDLKCLLCDKPFVYRSSMIKHQQKVHNVGVKVPNNKRKIDCDDELMAGDKSKKSNFKLKDKEAPFNTVNYVCDLCSKSFKSKQTVLQHLKSKHGSQRRKPADIGPTYKCDDCANVFTGLMVYRCHMRQFHPDKPWIPQKRTVVQVHLCDLCGNEFATRGQLKAHMNHHNNERPFKCQICGRDYLQKAHLKDHLNTHSGAKPYKCLYDGCTREFTHASGRVAHHKIVHEVFKKYKCEFCPREYGLKTRYRYCEIF